MNADYDVIIISHSEVVRYEKYRKMPLERIDLYRNLVQYRMVYHDGGFLSHLDLLNKVVYGKTFHEASSDERRKMFSVWNLPSFNGMLAVNRLVENGFHCKVINNFDAELDLLSRCAKSSRNPIVAISSTFIFHWGEVGRISAMVRKLIPNATIVLGGAFVNDRFLTSGKRSFEKYLSKYSLDYIIYSFNSDTDFLALVQALRAGTGLGAVNNLAYLDSSGKFATTQDVWNEPTINYPEKSWSKLYSPENMGGTLQLRTTSSCPFTCAYCTYPVKAGKFKTTQVEMFERQLEAIHSLGAIERLFLIDDTPNIPLARFRKILDAFKKYSFKWYSFLRVQYMDEQLARDMAESGCEGVFLGLESANDAVLESMNKQVTVAEYKRGIALLKKNGVPVFGAFVIGFPGETAESVDDNIKFIEETGIDYYSLKEFHYYHSTPIHKLRDKWELRGQGKVWSHKTMSSDEAAVHRLRVFDAVKSSVYVDEDTGLWYLAYLRECGFNWDEIRAIQSLLTKMMSQDNANRFFEKGPLVAELRDLLTKANFKNKPASFAPESPPLVASLDKNRLDRRVSVLTK